MGSSQSAPKACTLQLIHSVRHVDLAGVSISPEGLHSATRPSPPTRSKGACLNQPRRAALCNFVPALVVVVNGYSLNQPRRAALCNPRKTRRRRTTKSQSAPKGCTLQLTNFTERKFLKTSQSAPKGCTLQPHIGQGLSGFEKVSISPEGLHSATEGIRVVPEVL